MIPLVADSDMLLIHMTLIFENHTQRMRIYGTLYTLESSHRAVGLEEIKVMTKIICEMCGGNDIMKEDGVFVCQYCGCKYSLEEARKMIVEGTVEVTGTVKVDTTTKLQNLYTLARRAKDDDNTENAAKYYAEIAVEDPNSWEAAFYSVYYTAMSCRIGEIVSAAESITHCMGSVMMLIKNYVKKDEQKAAYSEVALRSVMAGTILFNASKNTYLETDYSDRLSDFQDRASSSLLTITAAGLVVLEVFDDVMLAKMVYESCIELCESFYHSKMYSQVAKDKLDEIRPRFKEIQEANNKKYWSEHVEERNAFESEEKSLSTQIKNLEEAEAAVPGQIEIDSYSEQIRELSRQKSCLSVFKIKERRILQTQIDQVNSQRKGVIDSMTSAKAAIQREIGPLKARISEIHFELTKDR